MKTMKYDINKDNSIDDHQNIDEGGGNQVANACFQCFKVCCKKKANFGLEDLFWLSFLILIIILSIVKSTTRIGWSQFIYVICGSVIGLIVVYLSASIINKFCFDDASTAHWNAHARFTQAALAQRLNQEEHKVHVIAPPRMGGAKLNILYTVGDVPITVPTKGINTQTTQITSVDKSCPLPLPLPPPPTTTTTTAAAAATTATATARVTSTINDSPKQLATLATIATNSAPHSALKNNSKSGANSGDVSLSPNYELITTTTITTQPPNYANTSETLYEEQEKY